MTGIPASLDALRVPVDSLKAYPRNPRRGDVGRIAESLKTHGQYRPIVVNEPTMEVLAGNHTLAAAVSLGWTEVAATFISVSEDQAARIALIDNRANDLAGYDDQALAELLASLDGDLDGTGFQPTEFEELLRDLAAPTAPDGFADPEAGMTTEYKCPACGYEWSGTTTPPGG